MDQQVKIHQELIRGKVLKFLFLWFLWEYFTGPKGSILGRLELEQERLLRHLPAVVVEALGVFIPHIPA